MTRPGRLAAYLATDFNFSDFAPGDRVLDVGCGRGRHLHELGDTLCQTDGMMGRYFRNNQLEIELAPASRRFLGLQVFHYYVLRKQ